MRMALYFCGLPKKLLLPFNHEKSKSEKSQLQGILQNTWPVPLHTAKDTWEVCEKKKKTREVCETVTDKKTLRQNCNVVS